MANKPSYSKSKKSKSMKYKSSKSMKSRKMALKKPISNSYIFKRFTQPILITHQAGDAANIWRLADTGKILTATFSSGVAWGNDSMPGTYANYFGARHKLNDIVNFTEFSTLFDRYKIVGVKAKFLYQSNSADTVGGGVFPVLQYRTDNDNDNPVGEVDIRQAQNCKQVVLNGQKPVKIYYRPKNLISTQATDDETGVTTTPSAAMNNRLWLNSNNSSVNHYGLKFNILNLYGTTSVNAQIRIDFTYYVAFKDPQ